MSAPSSGVKRNLDLPDMNYSQDGRPSDPFEHLPQLRDRLIAAEHSRARVTAEVLASWDKKALEMGEDANWRQPDTQREANRVRLLAGRQQAADVWVFAYGSLMWDPGFYFAEVRRAQLSDHERSFNYQVIAGRGTPTQPGLVLSLMPRPGRSCEGLAFRIAAERVEIETQILWRREMLRGGYNPKWLDLQTPQGHVCALVFAANPEEPMYVHGLSQQETAHRLTQAQGHLGKNRDYLEQLAQQLQCLDIEDSYVIDLHRLVAAL